MFDHVTIRVSDRRASEAAYRTVLGELGVDVLYADEWFVEWGELSLKASDERPATTGLHIGFVAPSRAHVDAFWHAGRAAGLRDAGAPGERPDYKPDYYGAFLLDPDGNSIEAVHHASLDTEAAIDHLWLRASDIEASRAFYTLVAPLAGLRIRDLSDDHVQVLGSTGSFSVVPGTPTRGLHMAFPRRDGCGRRRVPSRARRCRVPRRRPARGADGVSRRLLRRLRSRSRRLERRARQSQPVGERQQAPGSGVPPGPARCWSTTPWVSSRQYDVASARTSVSGGCTGVPA